MVAARGLVVVVIILHKERRVLRKGIHNAAGKGIGAVPEIFRTLFVDCFTGSLAGFFGISGVEITVPGYTGHIVHGRGHGRFDTGVDAGSLQSHAAPAADADYADAFRVHQVTAGKKIDRRLEIFHVDIRGVHRPREAAGLSGEGWIKGESQEAAFRHFLCIQPGGLFLAGAERSADGDGGKFPLGTLRDIHVRGKRDAEMVGEGHFAVVDVFTLREYFIPFLCEVQFFSFHHGLVSLI